MEFKHNFSERIPAKLKLGYSFDPVPGFQEHLSESVEVLLRRYASGDISVGAALYADDVYPFDSVPDAFDVMDEMANISERSNQERTGNSVFSDSVGAEQPLGNAQAPADNPGNTEASLGAAPVD